jgi:hypothetical protein
MIDVRARDTSGARNGLRFLLRGLSAALAILFVTSCGNNLFIVGTPIVTLTVNHGQFTSYVVSIDEILMTRKDGTVVQVPIGSEEVDLAKITNTVQLLSAPALQEGTYVSATLQLNYSVGAITIAAGGQSGVTTLIDEVTGVAPGQEQFTINFDPNNPLVVGNQTGSLINFNIDLEASSTVDNSKGFPATVTIHPMVTASAVPVYDKPIYVRGLFVLADTNSGTFVMNTRPLHDIVNQPTGAVTIIPSATTYYNIDGVTYVGAAGIKQLDALKAETASLQIAAVGLPGSGTIGNLGKDTPTFVATEVYGGSSLESTIQDRITGIVAGRSGETLTIIGASLVDRNGTVGFTQSIPVTLAPFTSATSPGTVVSVDGVASPSPAPTIDTISVGQAVEISGQVNPADASNGYVNPDGSSNPTGLDATFGQVRIKPTTLWATLNSATPGSALVTLDWIQDYQFSPNPLNFDFTGVGTNTSASNYTINTGSTDLSAAAPGTLLNIVGVTNAFGSGPPDFTATTTSLATALPQKLIIEWSGAGSANPFPVVSASGIYVNLQDTNYLAGAVHGIRQGPVTTDIATLPGINPNALIIVPATSSDPTVQSTYQFSIGNVPNSLYVYSDPTAFAQRIQYNIGAIGPTKKLVATGQYDGAGNFVATNIEIVVH